MKKLLARVRAWFRKPAPPREAPLPAVDLTMVGTVELFNEISRRHDASLIAMLRVKPDGVNCSTKVMSRGLGSLPEFLRHVASEMENSGMRDLREGDI